MAQKDPVMALNELCQKSAWPMPAFELQQVGNPPRFRVCSSVPSTVRAGHGRPGQLRV